MPFTVREIAVLTLLRRRGEMTTQKMAKDANISWHSADNTLKRLYDRGYVMHGRTKGGTNYWRLV